MNKEQDIILKRRRYLGVWYNDEYRVEHTFNEIPTAKYGDLYQFTIRIRNGQNDYVWKLSADEFELEIKKIKDKGSRQIIKLHPELDTFFDENDKPLTPSRVIEKQVRESKSKRITDPLEYLYQNFFK